jgi:urea transporter
MKFILSYVNQLLYSYSSLLFNRNRFIGFVLLIITCLNPSIAIHGIIAWLATFFIARSMGIEKDHIVHAIFTYNSLLVGFSIGFLFKISTLSILMAVTASILTVLLSFALSHVFWYFFKLPVLNIPFTFISSLIYLASVRYSSLLVDSFYPFEYLNISLLPASLHGLFRAAGLLIFMPYDLVGIVILLAVLGNSRIQFALMTLSYFIGISFLALYKGSFNLAYQDISSFNFIIIGIALGGIFLIPSRKSYIYACLGVIISVFILDAVSVFWSSFGIPVFTLPFNIVVLLILYVLNQLHEKKINYVIRSSPEESLLHYLNNSQRFDLSTPAPYLPVSGKWTIYQAFNDAWTHKGLWKYAYDFVITDDKGMAYKADGTKLDDYYCYGKPVLSPINGTIVEVNSQLPDNLIGTVDKINNWGNFVIIYSHFGYYVELSHLKQKSITYQAGEQVQVGSVLGLCGNSGYSPQPHLHMQVQYFPQLGSETFPYYLSGTVAEGKLLKKSMLQKGQTIEPISGSKRIKKALQFLLDDVFVYQYFRNGKFENEIQLFTQMETDGSMYFTTNSANEKLFFGIHDNQFICYHLEAKSSSLLKALFLSAPYFPITDTRDFFWEEILPDYLFHSLQSLSIFIKAINEKWNQQLGVYHFSDALEIKGEIKNRKNYIYTTLKISSEKGFAEIEVQNNNEIVQWKLVRHESKKN